MGLILKVKTGDRIVINGAVLRNAGKGQMFVEVENRSDVLRGEDQMVFIQYAIPIGVCMHNFVQFDEPVVANTVP